MNSSTHHPLSDFINLIEENFYNQIRAEFLDFDHYYSSYDPKIFDKQELIFDLINDRYIFQTIQGKKIIRIETYSNYLRMIVSEYKSHFKHAVREQLLDKSEKAIVDYAKLLQKEISNLKSLLDAKSFINKEVVYLSLKEVDAFLYNYSFGSFINWNNTQSESLKLKWTGKVSVLATLFNELHTGNNNLKNKFLNENNRQELSEFIISNFVDSDGKVFNKSTVYRYLDPSKTDTKKSKDRINITDISTDEN